MTKLDFSKEDYKSTLVEFAPGSWVCGEVHAPGGNKSLLANNRTFVLKLKLREDLGGVSKGKECLFVYGLGSDGAIESVKKLEERTGLKAVALLCNGSGHHIFIRKWYNSFPEPFEVWACPTKTPQTENGIALMKDFPNRWQLADNSTTPHHVNQLYKFFGSGGDLQVDCVLFNQLFTYTDAISKKVGSWTMPDDQPETKPTKFIFGGMMKQFGEKSQPGDDVVFFHKATKLIITGHHWEFIYMPPGFQTPDDLKNPEAGFLWKVISKSFIAPDRYTSAVHLYGRIRDPSIHALQWQEVMKFDFEYATGNHDFAGVCGPIDNDKFMKGEGGLKGHFKRELEATGELNNTPVAGSWVPWRKANLLHTLIAQEPGFLKEYGPPPTLPMGGPDYDGRGMKK